MKQCPICDRAYSDPSVSFCLDDGALLSPSLDLERTLAMHNRSLSTVQERHRGFVPYLLTCILVLLLVGGGFLFASRYRNGAVGNVSHTDPSNLDPQPTTSPPMTQGDGSRNEWTVVVDASDDWRDSGIPVSKGQVVGVTATGSVLINENFPPMSPAGMSCFSADGGRIGNPIPKGPCGGLIM